MIEDFAGDGSAPELGPEENTLVDLVRYNARTRPDALAIERGQRRMTYGELQKRVDQLALALVDNGVDRGSVVGVHLGRSIEWVVAMLATLEAGGVCLTLDPTAPAARAARAVGVTSAAAIITSPGETPPGGDAPVLIVDIDEPVSDGPGLLEVGIGPDDLAYAVHTSGSSGEPKIVLAQHRWLSHGVHVGTAVNRTSTVDRGSWLGPAGAGIAVHEVCGLLWRGASIHVAEQEIVTSPPQLHEWLLASRITQAFVITPVGEMLQAMQWPLDSSLRLMTLGGDKLNHWAPHDLPFEVSIAYGALEAFQIANSLHPWERRCTPKTATVADRSGPPPVGRALPGVEVHLLEEDFTETSAGDIGEIWIDSLSLAVGYLGDPRQTADRFRPNPFGQPGSRLYRSGDAGRIRDNGILDHHGRIDNVVKVRGHRVEFGEVEWALGEHPEVEQVCVVAVRDDDDNSKLVACFVAGSAVAPNDLRAQSAERLPDFMIPVAFVQMDELPTNTSNKIDRLALPPDDWWRWRATQTYREPDNPVEVALSEIIDDLLAVERVGADDNFFDLGGDSLGATKLQGRVEDAYGVRIPLADIPTNSVAELARIVDDITRRGDASNMLTPIVPRSQS